MQISSPPPPSSRSPSEFLRQQQPRKLDEPRQMVLTQQSRDIQLEEYPAVVIRLGAEDGEHSCPLPRFCQNAVDTDGRLTGKLVRFPGFPFIYGITEKQRYAVSDPNWCSVIPLPLHRLFSCPPNTFESFTLLVDLYTLSRLRLSILSAQYGCCLIKQELSILSAQYSGCLIKQELTDSLKAWTVHPFSTIQWLSYQARTDQLSQGLDCPSFQHNTVAVLSSKKWPSFQLNTAAVLRRKNWPPFQHNTATVLSCKNWPSLLLNTLTVFSRKNWPPFQFNMVTILSRMN